MSDYKQKYLKYKNKYFELKNKLNEQTGGNLYTPGTYVFFLREKPFVNLPETAHETNWKPILTDPNVKSIESFNLFTDYIGDCALFLRVKSSRFGSFIGKIQQHRYDTVYPNISTTNMIKNIPTNVINNINNQNNDQNTNQNNNQNTNQNDDQKCEPIVIGEELKEGTDCCDVWANKLHRVINCCERCK